MCIRRKRVVNSGFIAAAKARMTILKDMCCELLEEKKALKHALDKEIASRQQYYQDVKVNQEEHRVDVVKQLEEDKKALKFCYDQAELKIAELTDIVKSQRASLHVYRCEREQMNQELTRLSKQVDACQKENSRLAEAKQALQTKVIDYAYLIRQAFEHNQQFHRCYMPTLHKVVQDHISS